VKKATADILNVDTDVFTEEFLTSADTLKLLGQIAEGDTDAILEL
jgi:hypothetical protein